MTDPKFIGPPQKLFKSYTMPKAKTATEIGKDIAKKTNVGAGKILTALGSPIQSTKKLLSKAKAKFTSAAERVKDISKGNISGAKGAVTPVNRPGVAKPKLNLTRPGKIPTGLGKQNPFVAQFVKNRAGSQVSESKIQQLKNEYKKMMGGSQIGPSEEKRLNKMMKMRSVKMANLKKIPEGPKGEGLRKLKAKRPDVTRKMGFAKKGKVMKAMAGKSVRGFGAARTSGMGLQDEQMVPGKSMDYYKDLM